MWIKARLEGISKSINVLDKLHLMKAVNGMVRKEIEKIRHDAREKISFFNYC